MGGDRGGRGSGPPLENHKLSHLFPKRKTGTNLPRESIRPPPPPVGIVWIRARMSDGGFYFLHVADLAIILSRDN